MAELTTPAPMVICQTEAERRIIQQYRELYEQHSRRHQPFTLIVHSTGGIVQLSRAVNLGVVKAGEVDKGD